MKAKRISILALVVIVALLLGVLAVAPFSAMAEGDGLSEETALIVTNYTSFKEAMEDPMIGYVKISSTFSSTITSETGALVVGTTISTSKTLIVDGNATFVASALAGVDVVDSLIQTTNGAYLTIKGTGTLCFKANGSNATNAVVRIDGGTVNIQDTVTLHGSYNTATQGCAILMNTGNLNIWGGNLKGEAGKYSNTNYFGALELRGGNTVINANAVVVGNKYSGANLSGEHPDKLTALTVSESAYLMIHSGTFKLTEGVETTSNSASIVVAESNKIGDYLFSGIRMLDAGTQQILATNVNKATASVNFAIPTNIFTSQPTFQIESAGSSGSVSFALSGSNVYSDVQLIKETGTVGDEFAENHAGIHFSNVGNTYTATEYKGDGTYQTPEGNYKIAVKIGEDWYYSNVFAINYGSIVISDAFIVQPSFQIVSAGENGTISFTLNDGYIYSDVQLVKETGTAGDGFAVNHAGVHFANVGFVYSATEYNGEGAYQTPEGNYKIAVKIAEDWYYSDVFAIDYGAVTVHTIYYGVGEGQGSGDFESDIENGTIYTLKAFNEVGNIIPPEGKEFDYWSIRTGSAMGEEIAQKQANETITITADTYAIAIWKDLPTFIVAYGPGEGVGSTEYEYVTTGTIITLLNPTDAYLGYEAPEGKLFAHWKVCKNNASDPNAVVKNVGDEITITFDTYIIAIWEDIPTFIVAYGPGDGVGSTEYEYVTTGTIVTLLNPADAYLGYEAPEGKLFAHWKVCEGNALDPNAVVKNVGDEITITFDTYIIAVWEDIPAVPTGLTASYNGTILAGNTLAINQLTVKLQYSDSSEMPCAGLCTYWYEGSQIQNPISYVFGEELIGNLTITVKYQGFETTFDVQVVGYEITFNANGGSGVMAGDERIGEYTLPICTFTAPENKEFLGWAIGAVDATPLKQAGDEIELSSDLTIYAIWREKDHVHALTPVSATPATCTENGNTAYYTCTCGQWFSDSEGNNLIADHSSVIIPATNHNYEGVAWSSDANEHYKVCKNNNCSEKGEVATHTPNIANPTEEEAKVCTVCGYVIAPALNHVHALTPVVAKSATCTENGNVAYYTCTCGQWFSDENATNLIANHDSVIVVASGHTDANTDGTCDTCGWVDPNFTPIVPGPGGGEGTPEPTPDNTPDTTPEIEGEEEAGLSGGAIAGIAVGATAGAVGLGVGGFAIFWFVVKKKSLAELLAIFKKAPKATPNGTNENLGGGSDDITE